MGYKYSNTYSVSVPVRQYCNPNCQERSGLRLAARSRYHGLGTAQLYGVLRLKLEVRDLS